MATVHLASDKLDGDANSTPPTSELHHRFQRARRSPGQMGEKHEGRSTLEQADKSYTHRAGRHRHR
jgi:hypothetical protein